MRIVEEVIRELIDQTPDVPPETGGILGERNGIICEAVFDGGKTQTERYAYVPNVERLNTLIAEWAEKGIRFAGIFHSHPGKQEGLSIADEAYIRTIMKAMPAEISALYFPIVLPGKRMVSHIAEKRNGQIVIRKDAISIER